MIDLAAIREATPTEIPVIDHSGIDEESEADARRLGDAIVGAEVHLRSGAPCWPRRFE